MSGSINRPVGPSGGSGSAAGEGSAVAARPVVRIYNNSTIRGLAEKRFGMAAFGLQEAGLVGTAPAIVDRLGELVEMGFGQIVLFTHDRCSDQTLELLTTEVIPKL